jgi:hypothetical protein
MFGLVYTQATATLWFVCLNSMIHTFMYTYYLLSACGIRLPGAPPTVATFLPGAVVHGQVRDGTPCACFVGVFRSTRLATNQSGEGRGVLCLSIVRTAGVGQG